MSCFLAGHRFARTYESHLMAGPSLHLNVRIRAHVPHTYASAAAVPRTAGSMQNLMAAPPRPPKTVTVDTALVMGRTHELRSHRQRVAQISRAASGSDLTGSEWLRE